MSGVDLHTHTTASDGTYAPAELVREAARRGVRVLAVTDHDSVDAVAPALLAAREHPPLEIVPGIEINTDDPGGEIHILGYFLDHEALWLRTSCGSSGPSGRRECTASRTGWRRWVTRSTPRRCSRWSRRARRVGRTSRRSWSGAATSAPSARPSTASSRRGSRRTSATGRSRPAEACEIIRRAGGLAVVAHPGFHEDPERMIRELAAHGPPRRRRVLLRRALPGADGAVPGSLPGAGPGAHGRIRLPRASRPGRDAGPARRSLGGLGGASPPSGTLSP